VARSKIKTLLILRHAKSSWKFPDLADHDRPLNKRGKRDAPKIGNLLKEKDLVPDIIISSTAVRAEKTAKMVAKASKYKGKVTLTDSLYAAGPDAYIDVLRNLQNKYNTVLVIGHNPGLEELVKVLSGEEHHVMPTCALAHIRLDIHSWSDIVQMTGKGRLVRLWDPHKL
jgi:phosphohistidine phosphatase